MAQSPTSQIQAQTLSDSRIPLLQRQAMAQQIGQIGGNHHLQSVIAQMKKNGGSGNLEHQSTSPPIHPQSIQAKLAINENDNQIEQDGDAIEDAEIGIPSSTFSTPPADNQTSDADSLMVDNTSTPSQIQKEETNQLQRSQINVSHQTTSPVIQRGFFKNYGREPKKSVKRLEKEPKQLAKKYGEGLNPLQEIRGDL